MAKLTSKESQEYRNLTDYIQEIYISYGYNNNDIEWKMITAQIKNMVKDGLRYSGILLTLNYMVNDKQKEKRKIKKLLNYKIKNLIILIKMLSLQMHNSNRLSNHLREKLN